MGSLILELAKILVVVLTVLMISAGSLAISTYFQHKLGGQITPAAGKTEALGCMGIFLFILGVYMVSVLTFY